MKTPTARPQPQMIALADLEIGPRLRPVSEAGVDAILDSIAQTGVMKDAIHVRRRRDGRLVLIAGAHRTEAAKRLGWTEIEAIVWRDVSDDWVALIEIDDNLAGAEMTALDTAVFLSRRKAIYERLHPEAKAGGDRRSASFQTEMISVRSFAASTAEKFGMTDRHVRNLVAAGSVLTDAMVAQLRTAKQAVGTVDLIELSKISDDDERAQVVLKVASGQAKKVRHARVQWAAETGRAPVAPVAEKDADYTRLVEAWTRATPAARRKFVAVFAADLAECGVGDA